MGRLQVATASLHCQEEKLRKRIRNVILPVQLHISVLNACIFRPDFGSFSSCNAMKYSSIMQIIFQFGSFSSCKWRLVLHARSQILPAEVTSDRWNILNPTRDGLGLKTAKLLYSTTLKLRPLCCPSAKAVVPGLLVSKVNVLKAWIPFFRWRLKTSKQCVSKTALRIVVVYWKHFISANVMLLIGKLCTYW